MLVSAMQEIAIDSHQADRTSMETWNEKLDKLIESSAESCSLKAPIQPAALIEEAYQWASPTLRRTLAEKRIGYEIGRKLRRRPSDEAQPLIPGLLDRYAETEGGYVHMSQLPRAEIAHRRNKLQLRIFTMTAMVAAYDELLSHDLPLSGEIG